MAMRIIAVLVAPVDFTMAIGVNPVTVVVTITIAVAIMIPDAAPGTHQEADGHAKVDDSSDYAQGALPLSLMNATIL